MLKLYKLEKLMVLTHTDIKEAWIQEQIANDLKLGLGDLIFKYRERMQPCAGRLESWLGNIY